MKSFNKTLGAAAVGVGLSSLAPEAKGDELGALVQNPSLETQNTTTTKDHEQWREKFHERFRNTLGMYFEDPRITSTPIKKTDSIPALQPIDIYVGAPATVGTTTITNSVANQVQSTTQTQQKEDSTQTRQEQANEKPHEHKPHTVVAGVTSILGEPLAPAGGEVAHNYLLPKIVQPLREINVYFTSTAPKIEVIKWHYGVEDESGKERHETKAKVAAFVGGGVSWFPVDFVEFEALGNLGAGFVTGHMQPKNIVPVAEVEGAANLLLGDFRVFAAAAHQVNFGAPVMLNKEGHVETQAVPEDTITVGIGWDFALNH